MNCVKLQSQHPTGAGRGRSHVADLTLDKLILQEAAKGNF
jgi:hypothetical protein